MKKHFVGATYDLTQQNMQGLIKQIEHLQKQNKILREGLKFASRMLNDIKYECEASVYTITDDNMDTVFGARDNCDQTLARADELEKK